MMFVGVVVFDHLQAFTISSVGWSINQSPACIQAASFRQPTTAAAIGNSVITCVGLSGSFA